MAPLTPAQQARVASLLRQRPVPTPAAGVIFAMGRAATVYAIRALSVQQPGGGAGPATPSGMIPPFAKPPPSRHRKKPGRKPGHPGSRRTPPPVIHHHQRHVLKTCPHCHAAVGPPAGFRSRTIEDIPEDFQPVVTRHVIGRHWCPACHKLVEPVIADALPKAAIGNRLLSLAAWLHYGLGLTISDVVALVQGHIGMQVSPGALVGMWHRLADILEAWYRQIAQEARESAVLHADETSWRLLGRTVWLWCFATPRLTWYVIDRCRGSPALKRLFLQAFAGTLVSDFWGAYNRLDIASRQVCLVHLLRELETVELYKDRSGDWAAFAKKLRRLLHDGFRLKKDDAVGPDSLASRKARLHGRLDALIARKWRNSQARRLVGRLRRFRRHILTFLDLPDVPADNNRAEREIRPAVIMRKNSYANGSVRGARSRAILMSVFRTLKLRGRDPLATISDALTTYINTGGLPPLPD